MIAARETHMFQISDVSCRSGSHISHFTYTQPRGTTHVLLSQNADYLDGLQGILTGNGAIQR